MSAGLRELLVGEIHAADSISFAQYMARVLYEPTLGYYSGIKSNPAGRKGDFITNVSIGSCYGHLLAEQIVEFWNALGQPVPFHLVEQGANDGQLMCDIVERMKNRYPECFAALQPHFIEPLGALQQRQRALVSNAIFHAEIPALPMEQGVFFCNELLDAFPVERVRWQMGAWQPMGVGLDTRGEFCWVDRQDPAVSTAAVRIIPGQEFAEGYTTEFCPSLETWMRAIAGLFRTGLWLITDYGMSANNYYAPSRSQGTLRGYRKHKLIADALTDPGETDLTAHVNWSQVQSAAKACRLANHGLIEQFRFLTALAEPLLKQMETRGRATPEDLIWLRRFQTLTHPSQFGSQFQTLILTQAPANLPPLRGSKWSRGSA